jgi:nitrate reductase NapE component
MCTTFGYAPFLPTSASRRRQAKKKRDVQLKKLFFLALGIFALVVVGLIFARIGIVFGQVFNLSFLTNQ